MIRRSHGVGVPDAIEATAHRPLPLASLRSDGARRFLDTWCESRIDHLVPCAGIMPLERLPDLVASLCQLEVEPLSQRLRFSFAGEAVSRRFGEDLAGRFLDQVAVAPDRAAYEEDCRLAIREARPVAALIEGTGAADGRPVALERLILPLTHGLRRADGVVCGLFEVAADAATRGPRPSAETERDRSPSRDRRP